MPSALPGLGGQGGGAPAADRPPDQERAGSRERVRQGGPRRDRDRPGAARDVRDDHPVQAASRVAAGHDAGQAGRRARPHRAACPACPTSGCRRSATASTCSPPASRARSASRWRAPTSRRSTASTGEIERVVKPVAGVTSALAERLTGGRYIDVDDRPRPCGALRPQHRRRAGGRGVGDRRRQRRRDGRGPAPLSDQRALSARVPRLRRAAARAADRDRARRADPPLRRRRRSRSATARRC